MLIRDAMPEDALRVAEVHVRTWQIAYRGLIPAAFLDGLSVEERANRYIFGHRDINKPQTLLALEGESVLGFGTVGKGRDADLPDQGELMALYVDPAWWGKRVGLALMSAARERLCSLGYKQAYLWLLTGNQRAKWFYELDGWRMDGAQRTDDSRGIVIKEQRMRREL
ncbi:MAG TPA: GNAT family N-acetyltransferase [Terracidiphilus sp.]|nr:GNAT family N-acetyltransferase [Terracidiphilus sp.]